MSSPVTILAIFLATGLPAYCDTPLNYFGFAAVNCGLDDPHDDTNKTDYTDEVAGFTNLNQVCIADTIQTTAQRLRQSARHFTPLFYIEPIFFAQQNGRLQPNAQRDTLLPMLKQAIERSGVPAHDLIFYLADEPTRRHLPLADLETAAQTLRVLFPETPIMVIEAYSPNGPGQIPHNIQYWGFNAYTVANPASEPRYPAYLNRAAAMLGPDQTLVMVLDAHHTPRHTRVGLDQNDMADVARAYYAYAQSRGDIAALIGYTWAGGIDGDWETGARNLPASVLNTYREIGHAITGK